jgi:uncharacterized membrane protein
VRQTIGAACHSLVNPVNPYNATRQEGEEGQRSALHTENLFMRTLCIIMLAKLLVTSGGGISWELQNETKDGVKVFTREKSGTEVREVQAMAAIDAPASRVYKVLQDLEHYKEFMPFVRESKVVSKEGNSTLFYSYIAPPVVANRDYTIRLQDQSNLDPVSGFYKIAWDAANDKGPAARDGTVRVEVNKGHWLLEPTEDGKQTYATYYVYTNPGGAIPSWLVNKANRDSVPDIFRAIRKRTQDRRYD